MYSSIFVLTRDMGLRKQQMTDDPSLLRRYSYLNDRATRVQKYLSIDRLGPPVLQRRPGRAWSLLFNARLQVKGGYNLASFFGYGSA